VCHHFGEHHRAKLLKTLINVPSEYADETNQGDPLLTFEFRDKDEMVVVRAKDNGQQFTGLIMPVG
jgi:hypothetical protein